MSRSAERLGCSVDKKSSRKHRYRFYFRSVIFLPESMRWLKFLSSDERLIQALEGAPFLAEKIHRPYFRVGYSVNQRLEHLRAHYEFALVHPLGKYLLQALNQPIQLAAIVAKDGTQYQLMLEEHEAFRKEGELQLQIKRDGIRIFSLSFSLTGSMLAPCLNIGCMQGPRPSAGQNAVRELTKNTHGLLPHKLMLFAAQSLAQVYGANSICAIGNQHHIYQSWRNRRTIGQDYDALWKGLGGIEGRSGEYELPLRATNRPIAEYPSHKRAEARRRMQLLEDIKSAIIAALNLASDQEPSFSTLAEQLPVSVSPIIKLAA